MRLLLVTDFYHPYSGGVEIHVRTIAHELAGRGHDVAVATMDTPDGRPRAVRDGPVSIFTVGHLAARAGAGFADERRPWAPPVPDPMAVRALRRIVADFEPDVIHGHDWLARSALPRIVSGSIPIVTSLHYYTRTCAKKTLWRGGEACAGPALGRCLACAGEHYGRARGTAVTLGLRAGSWLEDRRTSRWISVSAATESGNGLAGRPRSVVIANPVPRAEDPVASSPDDGAAALSLVGEDRFILFVGDIRPEKGLRVLTAAVERLRREHGDETMLVVAGHRTTPGIELPANTVELGEVEHEVVQALWVRATIGVIPSLWPEPFGLVAIEAMAAGCPLVASAVGGLREILGDGRALLVEAGDDRALAAAMRALLIDGDRRAALVAAARRAVPDYSVDRIVDALEYQYRTVIARTERRAPDPTS